MYRFLILILVAFSFASCNQSPKKITIYGDAQGTTYSISYYSPNNESLKNAVDSLLLDFDNSLSTYNPISLITRINNNEVVQINNYFQVVFSKSIEISGLTDGAFDVTGGPIFNVWGFGHTPRAKVDSAGIKELLEIIGYKKVRIENNRLVKDNPQLSLNFNAIAQGYSVDVVADFLKSKGIENFVIEIGGEIAASGQKDDGETWKVGIDKPLEDSSTRQLQAIVSLNNKALATSGNYRKFFEIDGQKYSHTIDPRTGYPTLNNLLSVTIIADDCLTADAFATAFMVMGYEKSLAFLNSAKNPGLQVYFIYDDKGEIKTYVSEGLINDLEELD